MSARPRVALEDLLLIGACVIWGINYVVIKDALNEFPPLAFNGLRFPTAAVILLLLHWRIEGFSLLGADLRRVIVLGLVGNFCYQLFFIYGLDNTRAGQASLFSSTTPLFTLVFAWVFGKDRISWRVAVGLLVAASGVLMLLHESAFGTFAPRGFWFGDLLLLGSAASWALYTVFSQPVLRRISPLGLTAVSMAAGGVPLLLIALPQLATIDPARVSLSAWGGLAYSTLLALVVSYLAWTRGIRMLGSTRTAVYVNLVPVIAVAVAWWYLGERLSPLQVVGGAGVIAGIAISRTQRRRPAAIVESRIARGRAAR